MYDASKIIAGLVIFVGLATYPFWGSLGKSTMQPEPKIATKATQCVESAEYMRANHMQMLDDWRHSVVRSEERTYTNSKGVKFEKSLSNTCLDCHENKEEFCDSCHDYASVKPYCWECHIVPKENI